MVELIRSYLSGPTFLFAWIITMLPCLIFVIYDLATKNGHLMSLMKLVWVLTVLYSGPLGLAIYFFSGRKEIGDDGLWRRSFRSVAHCYSGCGMGEIVGVVIATSFISSGNLAIGLTTFVLAYIAGYALTVGPLIQDGVAVHTALWDALVSETPSIIVMEIVAIGVDLVVGGRSTIGEPLFWSSMILSLTCGLLAAYPVNVLLVHYGVKEGMMDPRMTDHAARKRG